MARSAMAEAVAQLTQAWSCWPVCPPVRNATARSSTCSSPSAAPCRRQGPRGAGGGEGLRAGPRAVRGGEATPRELRPRCRGCSDHQHASGVHAALEIAEELLRSGERQRDVAAQAMGHRCLGPPRCSRGADAALGHFERALALYGDGRSRSARVPVASDTRVACLNFMPSALLWQGYPDKALARSRAALAAAEEQGHAYIDEPRPVPDCWLHQLRGDARPCEERDARRCALAAEHGFPLWASRRRSCTAGRSPTAGEVATGIARMRQGLAAPRGRCDAAARALLPGSPGRRAHPRRGSAQRRWTAGEALAIVGRSEERCMEAELHRLKGEAAAGARARAPAEAEACYHEALGVARGQGARLGSCAPRRPRPAVARPGPARRGHDLLAPVSAGSPRASTPRTSGRRKALLDELR